MILNMGKNSFVKSLQKYQDELKIDFCWRNQNQIKYLYSLLQKRRPYTIT